MPIRSIRDIPNDSLGIGDIVKSTVDIDSYMVIRDLIELNVMRMDCIVFVPIIYLWMHVDLRVLSSIV